MKYLTCDRHDRVGMNIYGRLSTMCFCYNNNSEYTYVHQPLPEPFETMFNLGKVNINLKSGFNIDKNNGHNLINMNAHCRIDSFTTNVIPQARRKEIPNFTNKFRQEMKRRYKPLPIKQKDDLNICVHVRRGDAADSNSESHEKYKLRKTSDSFLQKVFQKINQSIKRSATISVHSDSIIDFSKFETYGLNINPKFECAPEEAMQDMISCDVLFRSGASSFSGVCALYNENLVISDMPYKIKNLYATNNTYPLKNCTRRLADFK